MQIPTSTLRKLEVAARQPAALRGWQLSLRTLFLLTAVCGLVACFHQPLWAWGQEVWEFWFPSVSPHACGPCGMG